jgi:hypothetical protein
VRILEILFAATIVAMAQAPRTPIETAVVAGTVVDADTNAPVPSVVVTLTPASPAQGRQPQRAITVAAGRFAFVGVPAGRYTLTTTVGGNGYSPGGFIVTGLGHLIAGYLNGGYEQRRPDGPLATIEVRAGERIADARIRIWKAAAIDGTVRDESGEPLVGVVVAVVRVSSDGRLLTGPTTKTDDRGRYHAGALAPGRYVVLVPQMQLALPQSTIDTSLANPDDSTLRSSLTRSGGIGPTLGGIRAGGTVLAPAPSVMVTNDLAPVIRDDRTFVYQTTFHPASTQVARASIVTLRSGEERDGIDMHLQPASAVAVSGTLVDDAGPVGNFALRLVQLDPSDGAGSLDVAMTATDANGAFTFPLVPTGDYRVVAERPPGPVSDGAPLPAPRSIAEMPGAWANRRVQVGDQPVSDVSLRLRPGLTIRGRVEFDGKSPGVPLRQLALRLMRMQTGRLPPPPSLRAAIDVAGAFEFTGVPPGSYVLRTGGGAGWTLASVSLAGHDVTDARVEIADTDVDGMVVSLTDRPSELSGTVSGRDGGQDADAVVLAFPADRNRWRDARASTFTFVATRTNRDGTFTILGLPPGSYVVAAVADADAGDWPDEAFLARVAAGAAMVRVEPGRRETLALRTGGIR